MFAQFSSLLCNLLNCVEGWIAKFSSHMFNTSSFDRGAENLDSLPYIIIYLQLCVFEFEFSFGPLSHPHFITCSHIEVKGRNLALLKSE